MTKITVLSTKERLKFDSPPKFNPDDRALHFSISDQGETQIKTDFQTTLIGIYSGRTNEASDLGYVWKTWAIRQIIEQSNS